MAKSELSPEEIEQINKINKKFKGIKEQIIGLKNEKLNLSTHNGIWLEFQAISDDIDFLIQLKKSHLEKAKKLGFSSQYDEIKDIDNVIFELQTRNAALFDAVTNFNKKSPLFKYKQMLLNEMQPQHKSNVHKIHQSNISFITMKEESKRTAENARKILISGGFTKDKIELYLRGYSLEYDSEARKDPDNAWAYAEYMAFMEKHDTPQGGMFLNALQDLGDQPPEVSRPYIDSYPSPAAPSQAAPSQAAPPKQVHAPAKPLMSAFSIHKEQQKSKGNAVDIRLDVEMQYAKQPKLQKFVEQNERNPNKDVTMKCFADKPNTMSFFSQKLSSLFSSVKSFLTRANEKPKAYRFVINNLADAKPVMDAISNEKDKDLYKVIYQDKAGNEREVAPLKALPEKPEKPEKPSRPGL